MKELVQPTLELNETERLAEIHKIGCDVPKPPDTLPEPKLSENAWYIGRTRYARRDSKGIPIETPKELFWRVAYNIATAELLYGGDKKAHIATATKFYKLMTSRKFLPNTPTLLNTAKPKQQLSACFVLPVPDSLDGILETASDMAMIHKSGGGTGFAFSRLRPKNDILSTSGGSTTGPISFMQMYNDITSSIRQGGVRRGMEPIVEALSEDTKAFAEVIKLNAESEMEIVQELGVTGLPTFLVFKNGKIVGSTIGATSKMNLLKLISAAA